MKSGLSPDYMAVLQSARPLLCPLLRPRLRMALALAPSQSRMHGGGSWSSDASVRRADQVTQAGAVANVLLAGMKGAAGVAANSPALIADGVHSLSDLISDGVSLWALRFSRRPADERHPYGHGKFEAVGSAGVGVMLMAAGGSIGVHAVQTALEALDPAVAVPLSAQIGAAGVAALAIVVKEALFHATRQIGEEARSSTVVANAWHHRSDALSSVVALVGVGGSMAGMPLLDPLAGLLVSAMILNEGGKILRGAMHELTDKQVDAALLQSVATAARLVPEVLDLSNLRGRTLGPHLLIDMQVSIDPAMSASVAQQVATKVRLQVVDRVPQVSEVLVHFDTSLRSGAPKGGKARDGEGGAAQLRPLTLHDAAEHAALAQRQTDAVMRSQLEIEADVRQALSTIPEVWGCSHIRLLWDTVRGGAIVQVDVIMNPDLRVLQAMRIGGYAKYAIEQLEDVFEADVHLELLLPCNMLGSRDLIPADMALPRPDVADDASARSPRLQPPG
ncbi:hypothetical protein AB1Y20_015481 [Prymnesium parvum]|uniref:Cation efflux protein cytoplasmic domain-containing protein n=1 Tax=Prymnesium parvum TaxID=97485 RepID=A0AB34JY10_PRYPA